MPFVADGRRRSQNKRAADNDGQERQAEEEEWALGQQCSVPCRESVGLCGRHILLLSEYRHGVPAEGMDGTPVSCRVKLLQRLSSGRRLVRGMNSGAGARNNIEWDDVDVQNTELGP